MLIPHGTLVAVADGATLKLFVNKAKEPAIDLVLHEHPEIASTNAGSGLRHHHEASNPDADRKAEDGFAAGVAASLNRMALDGSVEHLFVIADPRTLGELRKHYHTALRGKIIGESSRDLTAHSAEDIAKCIRDA